jgi:hypothetical protein
MAELGFRITDNLAGMETAFVAEIGHGKPVIAFLGEFDALRGMSQEADKTEKCAIPGQEFGHGCGHNLLGVGSMAAAWGAAQYLKEKGLEGTVRYYGCPAEEGGCGKVYMVRAGCFEDVDAAFTWHTGSVPGLFNSTLANTGLSTADEMLYPDNYRYLSDLLAYVAVGARSVENQEHRLTSSGIAVPVGMKNPTSGDLSIMMNSIRAAQASHTFIYRGWEVETTGNPLAHAILRGYVNRHGESIPNYHFEDLELLYNAYRAKGLTNMALIVDANHANSGKKYEDQPRICKEVLHSCRHSEHIRSMVKGFMIESYLEGGAQQIGDGIYGKSITDPCLGWEKTERLIYDLADVL